MTLTRKLVRNYVLNKLLNGETAAGDRITNSKVTPNALDFPVIGVYTSEDKFDELFSENPMIAKRIITLEIQCVTVINDTYQDDLDDLCEQVENLIDKKLGKGIDDLESCILQETTMLYSNEGDETVAIALMKYNVTYTAPEPGLLGESNFDNLDIMYLKWEVPASQVAKEDRVKL